jgi:hypothetical protein
VPSWVLELSEIAKTALGTFDLWLQEEVWDACDQLAANPGRLRRRASPTIVHDFTVDRGGVRHYVFLSFELHPSTMTLYVVNIGRLEQPLM